MATQMSTNPESTSNNALVRAIHKHYSDTTYHRSSRTIESEKTLLCGIPFNRWAMFPTAFMYVFHMQSDGMHVNALLSHGESLSHASSSFSPFHCSFQAICGSLYACTSILSAQTRLFFRFPFDLFDTVCFSRGKWKKDIQTCWHTHSSFVRSIQIGSVFNDPIDGYIYGQSLNAATNKYAPLVHNAPITFYIAVGEFLSILLPQLQAHSWKYSRQCTEEVWV